MALPLIHHQNHAVTPYPLDIRHQAIIAYHGNLEGLKVARLSLATMLPVARYHPLELLLLSNFHDVFGSRWFKDQASRKRWRIGSELWDTRFDVLESLLRKNSLNSRSFQLVHSMVTRRDYTGISNILYPIDFSDSVTLMSTPHVHFRKPRFLFRRNIPPSTTDQSIHVWSGENMQTSRISHIQALHLVTL